MPAGWIRIQVAADESQFIDAALELRGAVDRRYSRRLRQLADSDEVVGIQAADSMNQIVAGLRPAAAGRLVADMMGHGRRARRENREVGAACTLQFELCVLQAVADLIVADDARGAQRHVDAGLEPRNLFIAKLLQRRGRRGVVAVTIDDHRWVQYMRVGFSTRICCRWTGSGQISANRSTSSPSFGMSLVMLGWGQSVPQRIRAESTAMRARANGTASRNGRLPTETRSEPQTLTHAKGLSRYRSSSN